MTHNEAAMIEAHKLGKNHRENHIHQYARTYDDLANDTATTRYGHGTHEYFAYMAGYRRSSLQNLAKR